MATKREEVYEFGPYRISAAERLLRRGTDLIPLPPKTADTLLVLVANAGTLLEKSDLIQAVWPDTFVEEGALTRNISLLRKALGGSEEESNYIRTIPKRGYQFVAAVRQVAEQEISTVPASDLADIASDVRAQTEVAPTSEAVAPGVIPDGAALAARPRQWIAGAILLLLVAVVALATHFLRQEPRTAAVPPGPAATNALAILPFRNVNGEESEEYFAEGMTQAMITGLAKLGSLRVVNLTTEPGGKLDAAALDRVLKNGEVKRMLTGAVLRSGGHVRVDAQLIDPTSRAVYWANSYDRDLKDVLQLESEVAQAIAMEIRVTVSAEEEQQLQPKQQINPQTLDAYLRGRYFWNRRTEESLRRAVQYFQQAIASDPTYALAYSGLADSYSMLGSAGVDGMKPTEAMPLAKAAALKAIELDPKLAEGHTSLAYVLLSYEWDLKAAEAEFIKALALNPASSNARHWFSHYYMAQGDLPKATTEMQAALKLEPLSPSINIGIGWCYYYGQQFDKAIEQYRSVVDADPGFPLAHQTLAMALVQSKMYEDAISEYQKAVTLSGGSPTTIAGLATAYAGAGKINEARAEMTKLEEMSRHRYIPALYFGMIHNSLGEPSETFRFAWKALGERSDYFMYLRLEPLVGKTAGNPEFIRLLGMIHR